MSWKIFVIKLLKSKVTLDKANLKQNNESTTLISGSLILCRIVQFVNIACSKKQRVNIQLLFMLIYSILQATPKSRPTGVTIIAILNIIGGVTMLLGGITLVAAGTILPSLPPSAFEDGNLTEPNVNLSGIRLHSLGAQPLQ